MNSIPRVCAESIIYFSHAVRDLSPIQGGFAGVRRLASSRSLVAALHHGEPEAGLAETRLSLLVCTHRSTLLGDESRVPGNLIRERENRPSVTSSSNVGS